MNRKYSNLPKITPVKINNYKQAKAIMSSFGVSAKGIDILKSKTINFTFLIKNISSWEANILKQHLLSLGSDAAIERSALVKDIRTQALIFGSVAQLKQLCLKLKNQPFGLKKIALSLSCSLNNLLKEAKVFKARDKTLILDKPVICGIINVTDDSFSGDGILRKIANYKLQITNLALRQAEEMVRAGARMLDVGAESSRPGALPIKEAQEIKRLAPIIKAIRKRFPKLLISVDTYKYKTALAASNAGADIVNDITGLRAEPKIAGLIKKNKLGCILMHMQGKPQNMQVNPGYKDAIEDIFEFLTKRIDFALKKGISEKSILIDPGIGFGKRPQDNYRIISELYKFKELGQPIFLGLSRKSFIGKILKAPVDKG